MTATCDSDDELDTVGNDGVFSTLQRQEMTKFPSAETTSLVADAEEEDIQRAPCVLVVDDSWKEESLRLVVNHDVWQVPFPLLVHAPAVGRDDVPLSRVSMSLSKFCDSVTARSAVAKALVHEHGANYVASRLVFVKMTSKSGAVAAFLPVALTGVDSSEVADELAGGVPIFPFPPQEVQSLLKSTSATGAIPKDFAKGGAWDQLVAPPYSKEKKAWELLGEREARRSKKARALFMGAETGTNGNAAEPAPVEEPAPPPPVVAAAPRGLPAVDGGALEAFTEAVTKTFLLKPEEKERTQLPIAIPPGVVARVTVELRAV